MKKLIFILTFLAPIWVFAQDFRIIDWKTNVLNVQLIETDTFKFEADPVDYNDPGAITREIGNYFIDFSARCFKIIGSDATTITVVDLEHINLAPQSNQIGRVYQSIVDADSMFHSIGGVDISAIDELSRWKDVARNNEHFGRKIKDLDGRDTTGIYHINRELIDSIDAADTTYWGRAETDPTISAWAKAATKPTYTYSEVGAQPAGSYLTSFTETDPTVSALVKSIDATDTTYWGRAETDPTISAWAKAATKPTYTYSEVGAEPANLNIQTHIANDGDLSSSNELQTISSNGNAGNITLSNSGGTLNLNVNDADANSTNEIQDLTRTGNTLSLSDDATTVDLSDLVNPNDSNYVTYTGNDKDLDMGAYKVTAQTAKITGLAGVGTRLVTASSDGSFGSSIISESGTTATVTGNLKATNRNAYYIGNKLMLSDYSWGGDNTNLWLGGATNSTVTGTTGYKGNYNNNIGVGAGYYQTTAYLNNNIGVNAGYSQTTAYYNNNIGVGAGYYQTTAYHNNNIGVNAGYSQTTAYYNNNIGVGAGYYQTTAYYNNNIGVEAGLYQTTASYNNNIGVSAGYYQTTASFNNNIGVSVGYNPDNDIPQYRSIIDNKMTFIGYGASRNNTDPAALENSVALGYKTYVTKSNQVVLGNSDVTEVFTNGNIKTSTLSGTGTRPIGATSDGTLAVITNDYAVDSSAIKRHITNDLDTVIGNEYQNLSSSKNVNSLTLNISNGTGTTFSVADGDSSTTNEIQDLTRSNDTIYLSSDVSPVVLNDFQHDSDTLTWDATLSDLADSSAAIRALANTKAVVSGTVNYIPKITGDNTLVNSSISDNGALVSTPLPFSSNVSVSAPLLSAGTSYFNNGNIELGYGRTGNNYAYIDLTGDQTYPDYGLRIIRGNTGADAISQIVHRGKGGLHLTSQDAAPFFFSTKNTVAITIDTSQNVGVGTTTPDAKFMVYETTQLGVPAGSYKKITREGGFVGNVFTNDKFLYRNSDGGGWGTAIWHDAINIDGVFGIPHSNTRTWWDRNPATETHSFGSGTTTYLTLNYSGMTLSGSATVQSSLNVSGYSTFSNQVEMTGSSLSLGANTTLYKNGRDVFLDSISYGYCGTAGQVLTSTGANSSPRWTTPATGGGSGISSIGMQVPTGLTVSPASLTANGTFTIGLQSGYSIPTTANQTNWNTAYANRITSAVGTTPLALSISNNTLSGYLSWTLTSINNATPSVGYLYYNGSTYSYQAATTTYTLPTASNSTLGGVQISSTDGGLAMSGNYLFQKDNVLTTRTPEASDYIAFYDNSATAQGKMTLSTLGSLIGGSGAVTSVTGTAPIISSGGTTPAISISAATTSAAGSMSAADKTKLDGFRSITPQSITTSASCATYCNFYTSASGSKTITFSNLIEGLSGQVEVSYSAASVITFAASGYTVMVASNIYNGTTGQVTSKSSGTAIYSYYVRNSKIYINGTQTYN